MQKRACLVSRNKLSDKFNVYVIKQHICLVKIQAFDVSDI